ncbi:MAG: acetoacetate decarboxylase family protein [Desertifilum sp. SIO1I2]|nr:acetoacetate decarboxylase family protein [Desertifilum sp. SIO1I2]
MVYPPSPWTLRGFGLQTVHLVDLDRVRSLIPHQLEIVSLFPGKTLGGIYLARYERGSTLEYNELIAVAAIVRSGWRWGGWISHIYVDNPDSVAGGREIWHLPKELAQFHWEGMNHVTVRQEGQILCSLQSSAVSFSLPLSANLPVLSCANSSLFLFHGEFQGKTGWVDAGLSIPRESPLAALGLAKPWLSLSIPSLNFVAQTPTVYR